MTLFLCVRESTAGQTRPGAVDRVNQVQSAREELRIS